MNIIIIIHGKSSKVYYIQAHMLQTNKSRAWTKVNA